MKKLTLTLLLATALPAAAQEWSIGVGTGAFVFGDFVERRVRPIAGPDPAPPVTQVLSAATRAGLAVDIERSFSDRWAVRFEGAFTRAPLTIREEAEGQDEFEFEAGEMDVATFMLPIVFRINPRGSFRFNLMGGPAYALYRPRSRENAEGTITVFDGTRGEWGGAAGIALGWYLSDRFAVEGAITDIITSSPFKKEDFGSVTTIDISETHNVHTTIGIRYRF